MSRKSLWKFNSLAHYGNIVLQAPDDDSMRRLKKFCLAIDNAILAKLMRIEHFEKSEQHGIAIRWRLQPTEADLTASDNAWVEAGGTAGYVSSYVEDGLKGLYK